MSLKQRFTRVLLALSVCLAASQLNGAAAHALGLSTSVLGGLNQTVSSGGSTGYTAGARLGFGLGLLDADISGMFLSRGFSGSDNVNWIEIPVVIRYPFLPAVSLGAGGYYDVALTSGAATVYGLRGSLQINPPALPVFIEGNFDYSLGEGGSGNANDLQLLVGLHF